MSQFACEACGGEVTAGHKRCRKCWVRDRGWDNRPGLHAQSTDWILDPATGVLSRQHGDVVVER